MRDAHLLIPAPFPWKQQLLCLMPLGIIVLLLYVGIGSGDELTIYFSNVRLNYPVMTKAVALFSNWCVGILYAAATLIFLYGVAKKKRQLVKRTLIFAVVQIGITVFLVQAVKYAAGVPRPLPALAGAERMPFSPGKDFHSFPSGHTSEIAGAASFFAVWMRGSAFSLSMGLLIGLVGFSRVYLSRHHLSDLLAGALTGLLASLAIHYLCSRGSS